MDYLNVIVENGNVQEGDREMLFPPNEPVEYVVKKSPDIYDLLLQMESFSSRSQAKKNWKGPTTIPDGWSEFYVGKKKRHLCLWAPTF